VSGLSIPSAPPAWYGSAMLEPRAPVPPPYRTPRPRAALLLLGLAACNAQAVTTARAPAADPADTSTPDASEGAGTVSGAARQVTLLRGARVELGEGVSMTFRAHGHKSIGPDQVSPLIVYVEYRTGAGASPAEASYSLFPPTETRWRWERWSFELTDYDYDARMDLRITEHPVPPAR